MMPSTFIPVPSPVNGLGLALLPIPVMTWISEWQSWTIPCKPTVPRILVSQSSPVGGSEWESRWEDLDGIPSIAPVGTVVPATPIVLPSQVVLGSGWGQQSFCLTFDNFISCVGFLKCCFGPVSHWACCLPLLFPLFHKPFQKESLRFTTLAHAGSTTPWSWSCWGPAWKTSSTSATGRLRSRQSSWSPSSWWAAYSGLCLHFPLFGGEGTSLSCLRVLERSMVRSYFL